VFLGLFMVLPNVTPTRQRLVQQDFASAHRSFLLWLLSDLGSVVGGMPPREVHAPQGLFSPLFLALLFLNWMVPPPDAICGKVGLRVPFSVPCLFRTGVRCSMWSRFFCCRPCILPLWLSFFFSKSGTLSGRVSFSTASAVAKPFSLYVVAKFFLHCPVAAF